MYGRGYRHSVGLGGLGFCDANGVCNDNNTVNLLPVVPPDGTLIKASGPEVDLMQGGRRRWIPDMATFTAMGFQWSSVQTISDTQFAAIPQGAPLPASGTVVTPAPVTTPIPTNGPLPPGAGYQQVEDPGNPFPYVYIGAGSGATTNIPDGTLIKATGDEVDLVQNGQRRWIPDMATFNAMGFQWSDVQTISDTQFAAIPQGQPLTVRVPNNPAPAPAAARTTQQQLLALHSGTSSAGTSFSQFFNQYKGWIIAAGIGLVVGPPLLKKVTR